MNGVQRTAKLTLDSTGTLKGDVKEVRIGDRASQERWALRNTTKDTDMVKPIEHLLGDSLGTYQLTKAQVINLHYNDQPFGFNYSIEAQKLREACWHLAPGATTGALESKPRD